MACVPSSATTYYVKNGGNDYADGKTLATAWSSIDNGDQKGLVSAGDTVLVQPGTYSAARPAWFGVDDNCVVQLNNRGGTAGNPISYIANGPGVVINVPNISSHGSGIGIGVANLIIDGFEINGGTMPIIMPGSNHNTIIRNNIIQNTIASPMTASFMPGSSLGIYNNASDNVLFSNNVFRNLNTAGGGNITTASWNYWGHNNTWANNVFQNVGNASALGAWGNEGAIDGLLLDTNIYNNTFVDVVSAMVAFGGSTQSSNVKFINNIVKGAGRDAIRNDSTAALLNSYNLFWSNVANYAGNVALGTGEFTADPLLTGDLHLQAGSPAIDAGINVGLPYNGLAPDLGAFETVPEPGSILALGSGLLALCGTLIKRRR